MKTKKQLLYKDKYCTKFVISKIAAIKRYFGINTAGRVYYLSYWCGKDYFLCKDKVYIIEFDYLNKNAYKPIVKSAYIATLKDENSFEFKTVLPDDTTPKYREFRGQKIEETKKIYTMEDFKDWYSSPCSVNKFVNVPHKTAIEFLQKYKKTTFNSGRYLFYAKRDKDLTWQYFIYAYDLKSKKELKIYIDCNVDTKIPNKLNEVYVKDLSGNISAYQKLHCKKDFLKYSSQECKQLGVPNFYALEFVKQCIQPIEKDRGWSVCRPFLCGSEFDNIWIDDVLGYNKKPYFLLCNNNRRSITKIAAIDFYKPEYKSTEPYINGYKKRNHWNIDKETLKRLVKFLNEPWDESKMHCGNNYAKKIKTTNWQKLKEKNNENTAECNDIYEKLPSDLPIPDYTKLIKDN